MRKYILITLLLLSIITISYSQLTCRFSYSIIVPEEDTRFSNPRIKYLPVALLASEEFPVYTANPTSTGIITIGNVRYIVYNFDLTYIANRCDYVSILPFINYEDKEIFLTGVSVPSSFGNIRNVGLNLSFTTAILGKGAYEFEEDNYVPNIFLNMVGVYKGYTDYPVNLRKTDTYTVEIYHTGLSSLRVFAKEYKVLCGLPSKSYYYYSKFTENTSLIPTTERDRRWFEIIGLRNDLDILSLEELEKKGYTHCRIYKESDVGLRLLSTSCYNNFCLSKFEYKNFDPEATLVTFYAEVSYNYGFLRRLTAIVNLGSRSLLDRSNEIYIAYPSYDPAEPNYIVLLPNETFTDRFLYHKIFPIFLSPFSYPNYEITSNIIFRNLTHTITKNEKFYLAKITGFDYVYFTYVPRNRQELLSYININQPFNLRYQGIIWDAGRDITTNENPKYISNNFLYRNDYYLLHVTLVFDSSRASSKIVDDRLQFEISFKLYRNDTNEEFKTAQCYVNYIYAGKSRDAMRKIGPFFENELPIYYDYNKEIYYSSFVRNLTTLGLTKEDRYIDYEVFCTLPYGIEFQYFIGRERIPSYATYTITFIGFDISSAEGLKTFFTFFIIFFIPALVGYFVKNIYFSTISLILVSAFFFVSGQIPLYVFVTIVIISIIIIFALRHFHIAT